MAWGAMLPVCPARHPDEAVVPGALDQATALLSKCFAIARAATSSSCDGHGIRSAWVGFHYAWDLPWAQAVFDALGPAHPDVEWTWAEGGVTIRPRDGFGDAAVTAMLLDIQSRARRLLNQRVIDAIGRARGQVLDWFGEHAPTVEEFAAAAPVALMCELDRLR